MRERLVPNHPIFSCLGEYLAFDAKANSLTKLKTKPIFLTDWNEIPKNDTSGQKTTSFL